MNMNQPNTTQLFTAHPSLLIQANNTNSAKNTSGINKRRFTETYEEAIASAEPKPLSKRSKMQVMVIDANDFKNLVLQQIFSNDHYYEIHDDVNFSNCDSIVSLPNNLIFKGDFDLSGCTDLTSLPNHLYVHSYLNLSGCTGLTSLPNNLSVGGGLDLCGCASLTALPNDLYVQDFLNLSGCSGLIKRDTLLRDNYY